MRILASFCVLLALTLGVSAEEWSSYSLDSGSFQVEFPSRPQEDTQKNSSPLGEIESRTWTAVLGDLTYSVTFTELPRLAVVFGGSDSIYENARGDLLHHTLGKRVSWDDVSVAGHEGKTLEYRLPDDNGVQRLRGEALFVLVGNSLYVLNATGPADFDGFKKFFDSFKPLGSVDIRRSELHEEDFCAPVAEFIA